MNNNLNYTGKWYFQEWIKYKVKFKLIKYELEYYKKLIKECEKEIFKNEKQQKMK